MERAKTLVQGLLNEYTTESRSTKGRFALALTAVLVVSCGIFLMALGIYTRHRQPIEPLPVPVARAWPSDAIVRTEDYLYVAMVEAALLDLHKKTAPPPVCLHAASFFSPAPNVLLVMHGQEWHIVRNAAVTPLGEKSPRRVGSATDFHVWAMARSVRIDFASSTAVFTVRPVATLISPVTITDEAVAVCLQTIRGINSGLARVQGVASPERVQGR